MQERTSILDKKLILIRSYSRKSTSNTAVLREHDSPDTQHSHSSPICLGQAEFIGLTGCAAQLTFIGHYSRNSTSNTAVLREGRYIHSFISIVYSQWPCFTRAQLDLSGSKKENLTSHDKKSRKKMKCKKVSKIYIHYVNLSSTTQSLSMLSKSQLYFLISHRSTKFAQIQPLFVLIF